MHVICLHMCLMQVIGWIISATETDMSNASRHVMDKGMIASIGELCCIQSMQVMSLSIQWRDFGVFVPVYELSMQV